MSQHSDSAADGGYLCPRCGRRSVSWWSDVHGNRHGACTSCRWAWRRWKGEEKGRVVRQGKGKDWDAFS